MDKENYSPERTEIYINRNTRETIIELVPEEIFEEENEEEFDWDKGRDSISLAQQALDIPTRELDEEIVLLDKDEPIESVDDDMVFEEENDEDFEWGREIDSATLVRKDREEISLDIPIDEEKIKESTTEEREVIVKEELEEIPSLIVTEIKDTADYLDDGTLNENKYAFNHIIFLIDVSSSMKKEDKLPLLQQSMLQMIQVLRAEDKVSIITYGTNAEVLIDAASGADKNVLRVVIEGLVARGQSYGAEGVDMAYSLAKANFIEEGNNEIILASDGVFNSRNFSENKLYRKAVIQNRVYTVRLSTIGFGNASKALTFLETLASKGEGSYLRITSETDAQSTLVQNLKRHSIK